MCTEEEAKRLLEEVLAPRDGEYRLMIVEGDSGLGLLGFVNRHDESIYSNLIEAVELRQGIPRTTDFVYGHTWAEVLERSLGKLLVSPVDLACQQWTAYAVEMPCSVDELKIALDLAGVDSLKRRSNVYG